MSGFDDAFNARVSMRQEEENEGHAKELDRTTRIENLRHESTRQLIAIGQKAVSKLQIEGLPSVDLVADKGPLRRKAPVAEGWPLDYHMGESEYGAISHNFRWFLLTDGRLAITHWQGIDLESTYIPPYSKEKLDQRAKFDQIFNQMVGEIDIVVEADLEAGRFRFGGLTNTSHSYVAPISNLAFDEQTNQLMHAAQADGSWTKVRCVPIETAVAELVADAVHNPAIHHWPT